MTGYTAAAFAGSVGRAATLVNQGWSAPGAAVALFNRRSVAARSVPNHAENCGKRPVYRLDQVKFFGIFYKI